MLMKFLKPLFLLLMASLLVSNLQAQIVKDPTTWTFELKKVKEGTFKAIFHLKLEEGWHIYSLIPGGDGMELAPGFNFDKTEGVQLLGKVIESGKKITGPMDGVDGIVSLFKYKVDYS